MNKWLTLLLLATAIAFTACDDDDADIIDQNALRYDGDNAASPTLPVGYYEAAAYYPASYTANFGDRRLEAVDIYVWDVPVEADLIISTAGNGSAPSSTLFTQDITQDVTARSWNRIILDQPIGITDGLWITFAWQNDVNGGQHIGCDAPGSGVRNGDWLFQQSDGRWDSYVARYGESINWNIRGILSE